MSEYLHASRGDSADPSTRFAEIIQQNFESGFSLYEHIDAGIKRVLNDAAQMELVMNRSGEVSEDKIQECLTSLNSAWDSLHIGNGSCRLTGKLRATEYADDEEVVTLVGEPPFEGIGGREEDVRGYFYAANGFRGAPLGFDVEATPLANQDTSYRVVLQFGIDEDYADQTIWFRVYPEELEYIEPPQPSTEGAEMFIGEHFPELLATIKQLPDACGDDEQIRLALDDFVATIDFARVDSDMGSEEIIDTIEQFITDRLDLDNCAYTLEINGMIYGRRMNYEHVPKEYGGVLAECLIGGVKLFPIEGTAIPDGATSYRAALEVWYLVPERGGGRTPIFVPIDSLRSIVARRPLSGAYPFDGDTYLLPNEETEHTFTVAPLADREVSNASASPDNEVVAEQPQRSREESLAQYLEDIQHLHSALRGKYFNVSYTQEDDAIRAVDEAGALLRSFLDIWHGEDGIGVIVRFSGEGVVYDGSTITAKIDAEQRRYDIAITNVGAVYDDAFASRRGLLRGGEVYYDEDENGYTVRGVLSVLEADDMPSGTVTDPRFGMATVAFETEKYCVIDLSKDIEFDIAELNNLRRQKDVATSLEVLSGSMGTLVRSRLAALHDALTHGTSTDFVSYEDVNGLREIALAMQQQEEHTETVAQALETIFGTGRHVGVSGPAFNASGEIESLDGIGARLEAVIARHPYVPSIEPILILTAASLEDGRMSRRLVMPVSTLEELYY